ncbi:oxidoreductase [Nocardioides lianchengensis]|uniref:Short-chain dehydrogenase n=1 Tax=Nocardioides lianchengensis TaxID=1045774 RepID=A0A1G7BBM9_9ACTN|nr:oxidoreductase [Nocardioides lianchengensis]NYG10038.1 NAD(P)-dependent dehydrogenase (short-subunit alcohol dehydrogenase family) [Nocardioides lianchengensis]SDE24372.1 Short-chain dehydrogenase [Nocardioides lianchengensis]
MGRVRRWDAVPRQDGRRFVVTGASGGIGLETAKVLADRGARVTLAVRNAAKGEQAAAQMAGDVEVALLDVSSLESVRSFADACGEVDVLVNNAGVLGLPFSRSVDGFELQLATNHLGHFALANLLLPRITDRVVVVSSRSHLTGDLDLDDLLWERRRYQPYAAYAASKLANMLFLAELQRRLTAAGSTLRATGAHPGSTVTAITANTGSPLKTLVGRYGHPLVGMPAAQGALPTLYAATMDVPGNTYVGPHGLGEMRGWPTAVGRSQRALDPDLAKSLWTRSEDLTGVRFPF